MNIIHCRHQIVLIKTELVFEREGLKLIGKEAHCIKICHGEVLEYFSISNILL